MSDILNFIKGLFTGESGMAAQILSIMIAVNVGLTGVKSALDSIKDKTSNTVDNAIADFLGKVVGVLGWVVDAFSANKEHK